MRFMGFARGKKPKTHENRCSSLVIFYWLREQNATEEMTEDRRQRSQDTLLLACFAVIVKGEIVRETLFDISCPKGVAFNP
jgi:hypothetical protein